MGNCNGVIGYGKGQGKNFEEALDKAVLHAKKNLIAIPLNHYLTFPETLEAKFNSVYIKMEPRKNFNCYGSPILAHMITLTGITHCRFNIISRNPNPYALVLAYFKLVTQNKTPRDLCELSGKKVYR